MDTKWGMDLKGVERDGEFGQNTMHNILRELINKIVVIMDVLVAAHCDICLHIFILKYPFGCILPLNTPSSPSLPFR